MNDEQRCQLAREVFNKVFLKTDTLNHDNIGTHLAYLLGAILDSRLDHCAVDWSEENEEHDTTLPLFREWFPVEHAVWKHIIITDT